MTDTKPDHLKVVEAAVSDDPFDLEQLKVDQDFLETTNVKKLLTTVPVRKPNAQDFVRVHPGHHYRQLLAVLELKDDREIYAVNLKLVPELQTECFVVNLFTAINRQGVVFLWPARMPSDGRSCDWHTSAITAAQQAMQGWIRMRSNMSLGAYEIFQAESKIPDPEWPTLSLQELVRIAFRDRIITTPDHPVIRRLRGAS
jgi:hypothetical protein